ncbi:hypothetical protein SAMN05216276_10776 [Streptosporangium subroseum]|uniref:Uncharacterized protein n=1 Tax=Streptosporangium subroseum TaxID=106412 RepID=A0A239NZY0_9ACTN|nr:hypothetical protein SAMN05216276_10776 [Streptosporangium subroseum]
MSNPATCETGPIMRLNRDYAWERFASFLSVSALPRDRNRPKRQLATNLFGANLTDVVGLQLAPGWGTADARDCRAIRGARHRVMVPGLPPGQQLTGGQLPAR